MSAGCATRAPAARLSRRRNRAGTRRHAHGRRCAPAMPVMRRRPAGNRRPSRSRCTRAAPGRARASGAGAPCRCADSGGFRRATAPHVAQQLAVREHASRVPHERREQPVFERRQVHDFVVAPHLAQREIDGHGAEGHLRRLVRAAPVAPAQLRADPRAQFGHAERLGQVVVGARIERRDLLLPACARTARSPAPRTSRAIPGSRRGRRYRAGRGRRSRDRACASPRRSAPACPSRPRTPRCPPPRARRARNGGSAFRPRSGRRSGWVHS